MKRTVNILNGVVKKETTVFISRTADNIEIVETLSLFGIFTLMERSREVYLPNVSSTEPDKLRVITDAYQELHDTALMLLREEMEWSNRGNEQEQEDREER